MTSAPNLSAVQPTANAATTERWIALLGRRDSPTDGVEDYCTFLGRALDRRGVELTRVRVAWDEEGWLGALRRVARESSGWRTSWVTLHYTALAWSRRGFPFGALLTLAVLRRRDIRCAVVFHEPCRQGATTAARVIGRIRGACQDWIIRRLYRGAAKAIFTVPVERIAWLPKATNKAAFISIGANVPGLFAPGDAATERNGALKTIAVFCLSPGPNRFLEVADLTYAARYVQRVLPPIRLVVFGRGALEMRTEIEKAMEGSGVDVSVLGMLSANEVSSRLSEAAVFLFVGGPVSQTRGSALAGVACGLPIVGYSGATAGTPLEEAGLDLVPYRNREALNQALARVLTDKSLQAELRDKSRRAHEKYFSWDAIADRYRHVLDRGISE